MNKVCIGCKNKNWKIKDLNQRIKEIKNYNRIKERNIRRLIDRKLKEQAKEVFKDIENNLILNKYCQFQIKCLKEKWCK